MEKATIDALISIIQQVGFPVVVAGWLLWRTDKRLEAINVTLVEISKGLVALNQAANDTWGKK